MQNRDFYLPFSRSFSQCHAQLPEASFDLLRGLQSSVWSAEAYAMISEIMHLNNGLDDLPPEDRLTQRQKVLLPKDDAYFEWMKHKYTQVTQNSTIGRALAYSINQEKYLRVFLSDPNVPMDNNAAEQAIRPFTIGRKNFVLIESDHGAKASAILYSLVETAKANHLNPYKYFELLLTEIPKHQDEKDLGFLSDLLPWSERIQRECASGVKRS